MTFKPTFETSKAKSLSITIEYVFRGGFNDTYWLEERTINIDELDKESLTWFDPFNGKNKLSTILVALAYCSDERFVILEKVGDKVKEHEVKVPFSFIACEDYDESKLIAAHIKLK